MSYTTEERYIYLLKNLNKMYNRYMDKYNSLIEMESGTPPLLMREAYTYREVAFEITKLIDNTTKK